MISGQDNYTLNRKQHWNQIALQNRRWSAGKAYHQRILEIFRFLIPEGSKVLEIGCGNGDLLAGLKPSLGVGIDFSPEMISLANRRHPDLSFVESDGHTFTVSDNLFDYIILSDLVNDLWNVQEVLKRIRQYCGRRTLPNSA